MNGIPTHRESSISHWENDREFAEAIHPHVSRLVRTARRILGSDDLARDAVQEALITLWRLGPALGDTYGWLHHVVIHRSLHARRTRARRERHERCGLEECRRCASAEGPSIVDRRETLAAIALRSRFHRARSTLRERLAPTHGTFSAPPAPSFVEAYE